MSYLLTIYFLSKSNWNLNLEKRAQIKIYGIIHSPFWCPIVNLLNKTSSFSSLPYNQFLSKLIFQFLICSPKMELVFFICIPSWNSINSLKSICFSFWICAVLSQLINQFNMVRVFPPGEARHDKLLLDSRHHYPRSHQVWTSHEKYKVKLILATISLV